MSVKEEIGQRIRSLRMMTRRNRREFSEEFHFNQSTLTALEFGRMSLSKEQLKKLLEIFSSEGIRVSPSWIFSGEGVAPKRLSAQPDEAREEDNSIVIVMEDESMSPFYEKGDYVGGNFSPLTPALSGQRCIIKFDDGSVKIRIIHKGKDHYIIQAANPLSEGHQFSVIDEKNIKVAKINWHKSKI